jgi:two-component system, NarL family, response regulator NreC
MIVGSVLRIVVADDHAIVRQGLKLLMESQPDMEVVGEAADGKAVLELATALKPDIVVMDISMPGVNGLIATRRLKQQQPGVTIVALTRHEDDTYLEELLRAGASAYVLKQSAPVNFLQAIRAVAAGGIYLDPAMTSRVAEGMLSGKARVEPTTTAKLTERESEVLRLVAMGHSNVEIAARLNISVKTVEAHKTNAMRKLGLAGRVDVIRYGVLQGWLYDT